MEDPFKYDFTILYSILSTCYIIYLIGIFIKCIWVTFGCQI